MTMAITDGSFDAGADIGIVNATSIGLKIMLSDEAAQAAVYAALLSAFPADKDSAFIQLLGLSGVTGATRVADPPLLGTLGLSKTAAATLDAYSSTATLTVAVSGLYFPMTLDQVRNLLRSFLSSAGRPPRS